MDVCAYLYVCLLRGVTCEFGCMNAEVREEHWCRDRFLPSPFLDTERLLSFTIAYTRLVDPRTPGDSPVSFSPVHEEELGPQCPCGKKLEQCTLPNSVLGRHMHHAVSSAVLHSLPILHLLSFCIVFIVLRHSLIMQSILQFETLLHHLPKGWDGKYMSSLPTHL